MSRRLGAILALLGFAVSLGAAAYALLTDFPRGLVVLACVLAAIAAAWFGLLRQGWRRLLGAAAGLLLIVAAVVLMASGDNGPALIVLVVSFAGAIAGA